jgi:hypothetical protein
MPNLNMTVELKPEDIKRAIREYVERELLDNTMVVGDVSFKVREPYHSADPREASITAALESATAKVMKKTKVVSENFQDRNMQSFYDK